MAKLLRYMGRNTERGGGEVVVEREGERPYLLDPRLDLRNHSPTGFAWGYGGSGPAQLALAILADFFRHNDGGDEQALALYQEFKFAVIACLPMDQSFELQGEAIDRITAAIFIKQLRTDNI